MANKAGFNNSTVVVTAANHQDDDGNGDRDDNVIGRIAESIDVAAGINGTERGFLTADSCAKEQNDDTEYCYISLSLCKN